MAKYPEKLQKADKWLTEQMIKDGAPKPSGMSQSEYDRIRKSGSSSSTSSKKSTSKKK